MRLLPTLLDLIFPRICAGCGVPVEGESGHICWDCLAGLEVVGLPFCSKCGDPVYGKVDHKYVCSNCIRHPPHYEAARSAVRYKGAMGGIMQAFKYNHGVYLSRDLVLLLEACARAHFSRIHFDAVTCVPLHARKERERTYNQSHLLARGLAHALKKPFWSGCLARARSTSTQTDLTAAERRKNVRDAFEPRHPEWIEGRSFLLVDDVMTTGATVVECSRVLKKAGAAGVYVVTVARG